MKNEATCLIRNCVLAVCLGVALFISQPEAPGAQAETWVLEIDLFSGRPNPSAVLAEAEMAEVWRLLAQGCAVPSPDPATLYPSVLGYRGVEVQRWAPPDTGHSIIRVRAQDVQLVHGTTQTWLRLPSLALERYLIELAHEHGALDPDLYRFILLDLAKRPPNLAFLDDFNGPSLDAIWSAPLPSTSNEVPSVVVSYVGPPAFAWERAEGDTVLRLTNQLAPNTRRGWISSTGFPLTQFRLEARSNTLEQGAPNSVGGFLELWVLDATAPGRFARVSLVSGVLGVAPSAVVAASSVGEPGTSLYPWWSCAPQTYYRLVIEGAPAQDLRAALLDDEGNEILSHTFPQTPNAFPSGLKIGLSQGGPWTIGTSTQPTAVAVDFVLLTGSAQTNQLDQLKQVYGFERWAGRTRARYAQPVTDWVPDFASLGVTNFLWRAEGIWTNGQKSSGYRFESPEATGVRVELRVWERADVTNAQLAMLEAFTFCAAWQPFPLGPSVGVDVGDRCYVGWGPPEQWIVFVRNNVCVYLAAYPEGSVLSLAHRLDSDLAARSFAGPVLLEVGRAGQALRVSTPTAVGRVYVLEFAETLDAASWTELTRFTGDGTIRQLAVPIHGPRRFFRLRVQ